MHVNMDTSMSYIVSSERTSRLPACRNYVLTLSYIDKPNRKIFCESGSWLPCDR